MTFDGTDVTGWRPDRLAGVGLSRTFQIARGLAQLSVIENLMLYGKHQPGETFCAAVLRTRAARAREDELRQRAIAVARELNLLQVGDNRAIDLSGGQKKLLELGRALMAEPKLIMLDEPAAGINPTLAQKLGEHILALKGRGITFLIIEHNMGLVAALCDHVVVLAQGKRLAEGRFADLRADRRVQDIYMAGGGDACRTLHGASGVMLCAGTRLCSPSPTSSPAMARMTRCSRASASRSRSASWSC